MQVDISEYLYKRLSAVPKVRIYGPSLEARGRAALCSFNVEGIHPTDIATFLDQQALQHFSYTKLLVYFVTI